MSTGHRSNLRLPLRGSAPAHRPSAPPPSVTCPRTQGPSQTYFPCPASLKTSWCFIKKLNIELPYDPAIPPLGVFAKELKAGTQADICTPMFTAALFTVTEREKQLKCPLMEWINQMCYMQAMEWYSVLNKDEILIVLQHERTLEMLC